MRNVRSTDPWVVYPKPNPRAGARLFCFPYAGGGPSVYRPWAESLPPGVELACVQYPGRGSRLKEPPLAKLMPLVEGLVPALPAHLDRPFAFFGHSMGAVIAFELARRLPREPFHLFVSGREAPTAPGKELHTYALPEQEFIEELQRLGGTPLEALAHPELMQLMLPMLRADFEAIQTYDYEPGPPLSCPITAFGGLEDQDVTPQQLEAWREQTVGRFVAHMLPGDHFFLHTAQAQLLEIVSAELRRGAL
ncbi:MAG: alpha/beta fold hydrolase, partial [Acidobacteriota bacterium]|nr:alpha/beta fold hydrolase [Acidobacteriota bacterium]